MNQPEPGPWANADDPWLMFGAGFELTDTRRSDQLATVFTWRTNAIVDDHQLRATYVAAGIDHVFFVFAVIDPHARPAPARFHRHGTQAFGKASFPDDPSRPLGDDFDAWLERRVRAALQSYTGRARG
jgi:hypothetical protein